MWNCPGSFARLGRKDAMGKYLRLDPMDPVVLDIIEQMMPLSDREGLRELMIDTVCRVRKFLRPMGVGSVASLEAAQEAARSIETIVATVWWEAQEHEKEEIARIFDVPVEAIPDEATSTFADSQRRAMETAVALRDALDAKERKE